MLIAAVILLTVNLLLLAGLLLASLRNARTLTRLRADAEALKPLHAELGPELRQQLTESGSRVIGIEILNPLQVAASQSWVAGRFGALAPGLIQREVYRQTREVLEVQLREYGIEPRVRVHGSRS
ncbi:hypothetical protein [Algiphilus aromaticivorans]|uniref:hypothetical protein n=1 Tax=Algiphilus aromaticivorans TaxID=382454 RepID=UPI0012EB2247|nr:hypothetical protein [Algiphilus aromaticivorans]